MKKLILAASAPLAMLALPASAQTTVQRTVSTPAGSVTTSRTVDHGNMRPAPGATIVRTTHVRQTITHNRGHVMRECRTQRRNHQRVRVCRTVRFHG